MPVFDPKLHNQPDRPKPAPIEYAGRWVAWDKAGGIVADGITLRELHARIQAIGNPEVVLQRVPPLDEVFVGSAEWSSSTTRSNDVAISR